MTICIPKKPFDILGDIIFFVLMFSWVPLFYFGIVSILEWNNPFSFLLIFLGSIPFYLTIIMIKSLNEEYHWIKWCDKRASQSSNKVKME